MADMKVAQKSGLRQGMTGVEKDGLKLLLVRDGETIRAFEGTCPHAEAPLHEGALCEGRIICPWHAGAFDAATGAWLEPVALRGLKIFPVRIDGDDVLVGREPAGGAAPIQAATDRVFVLVGAGAASAAAATTLRGAGFAGRLVMVEPDEAEPLDRTVLSKMALAEPGFDRSSLPLLDIEALKVERRQERVTAIDAGARRLTLAGGEILAYDAALLATGAATRRLDVPGAEASHVRVLRNLGDLDAILPLVQPGARAVVIGTSFIGMEAAAALATRKVKVTVVGEDDLPFARQFGERVAQALARLHEEKGVAFRLGSEVTRITDSAVVLNSGEMLPADLVLLGVGVSPALDYAAGLARAEDGGLVTDRALRVADGLWAAGDIASPEGWPRIEHWRVAQQHGRIAALGMLGREAAYDGVPFFWTTQHDIALRYVGHATEWDEIEYDGDVEKFNFIAWYVQDERVVAALLSAHDSAAATLSQILRRRISLAEARQLIGV